jgi:signal transduction histidine kinase
MRAVLTQITHNMVEAKAATRIPAASVPGGHRRTLAEQEMVDSLGWLVAMRWLAGLGVVGGTLIASQVLLLPVNEVALYRFGLAIIAYNAGLRWWLERLEKQPEEIGAWQRFGRVQILFDWLAMTVLTSLTGGVESPAMIFFLFHVSIAALLLPHAHAFLHVSVPPLLVAGVALLEYEGIVPHAALFLPPRYQDPVYAITVLFFFGASCYTLAFFCMSIARRLRRRENEIAGLYDSVRELTATLDLQTVLNQFVESATRVLDCKGAAIRLLNPARSQVEFAASYGLSEDYMDEVPVEFRRARLDQDTLAGDALFVNDAPADPRIWQPERLKKEGIEAMLSVPLVGKRGPLGVLRAYGAEGHRFTEGDAAFLEMVAAQGVVAIENAQAYKLLAEMNQEKSKFARITTHELRAPAKVTQSLLTALSDGYAGPLTEAQRDLVGRARRRVQLLQTLVDDLLDLASGKADLRRAERRAVSLSAATRELATRFEAGAREKQLALKVEVPEDPLNVFTDPADIDRILTNLVSNAVKYTPAGSVTVRLTGEAGRARLEVSDTGIGISPDALEHVFEEFYRATNAKAMEEAGTGLGLSIVKDLVDRYGGRIDVTSTLGQGTTFTVALPLMQGEVPPADGTPALLASER